MNIYKAIFHILFFCLFSSSSPSSACVVVATHLYVALLQCHTNSCMIKRKKIYENLCNYYYSEVVDESEMRWRVNRVVARIVGGEVIFLLKSVLNKKKKLIFSLEKKNLEQFWVERGLNYQPSTLPPLLLAAPLSVNK